MIKKLTIIIFALVVCNQFLFASNVKVTSNLSTTDIKCGSEFTIEITVKKGAIAGFAKIQQTLPVGFTATQLETKSATFSYKEDKVKFLWMSLPQDDEFIVSYKIKVDANASGTFQIDGGVFSYIENNQTEKFQLDNINVNVSCGGATAAVAKPATPKPVVDDSKAKLDEQKKIDEQKAQEAAVAKQKTDQDAKQKEAEQAKLKADQDAKQKEADLAKADNAKQKLADEEKLKAEQSKVEADNSKAKADNEAKAILEKQKEAEQAKLKADADAKAKIEADKKEELKAQEAAIAKQNADKEAKLKEAEQAKVQAAPVKEPVAEVKPAPKKTTPPVTKKPNTPTNKTAVVDNKASTGGQEVKSGISFKIQVASSNEKRPVEQVKTKLGLNDELNVEQIDGTYKYTVKNFATYSEAKEYIKSINATGAFVVAYSNGKRITVKEAIDLIK